MSRDPLRETLGRLRGAAGALEGLPRLRPEGSLLALRGQHARVHLPGAQLGASAAAGAGSEVEGEVVALRGDEATLLLRGPAAGLEIGAPVRLRGTPVPAAGPALLGRVIDPLCRPLDGGPALDRRGLTPVRLDAPPPVAHARRPVDEPLWTGVRSIDALCTLGRGGRVGLFAPAGTGKTRLVARLAAGLEAEVVVLALVGERGRELEELRRGLPAEARARTLIVAATGAAPAHQRARALPLATALAEHFRREGREVVLLVDSLTRHLRAEREIALSAGEPLGPAGYPASALARLPRLLERAGNDAHGRMSAIYTVLEEGSGLEEELRGLLDGHLVLSRELAERGHYPALDPVASLSRLAQQVADEEHLRAARRLRRWARLQEERRELMVLGAWEPGRDPEGDEALARWPGIEALLQQEGEPAGPGALREALLRVAA
ncbi:MAG: EscN/YscN/HrcN family type III secretion system ATPase [Deltaproteobacteria bacterium]|nr:EscN/YscN/HrcN family type III secretion system ATPase [Deltaproteobacteria bacterium]